MFQNFRTIHRTWQYSPMNPIKESVAWKRSTRVTPKVLRLGMKMLSYSNQINYLSKTLFLILQVFFRDHFYIFRPVAAVAFNRLPIFFYKALNYFFLFIKPNFSNFWKNRDFIDLEIGSRVFLDTVSNYEIPVSSNFWKKRKFHKSWCMK